MDSRPPPPQGPPPSYAFVTKVYKRSLRPVVIFICTLTGFWSLFTSIGFFRAGNIDKPGNRLFGISIALGILYLVICLIAILGVVAACLRRLALVRIYSYSSILAALVAAAAGLFRVVVHYVMKGPLIEECSNRAVGEEVIYRFGWFGPRTSDVLDAQEAAAWCRRAWERDSWAEIVELLLVILIAACFVSISLSYYRQLLDPNSIDNATRAPSYQARVNMYPQHYQPPYGGAAPPYGYGYNMPYASGPPPSQYAPPSGPPPNAAPPYYPPRDGTYSTEQADNKNQNPFADFNEERQREAYNTQRP